MKRYEMLKDDTIRYHLKTLYRIRALVDMPEHGIKAGDLGGYLAAEKHLKQIGTGWIYHNAKVLGGTICGGDICGGTIHGGTIHGGTIWGGAIWGGAIWGGIICSGDIWGGDIHGGTIWGGDIHGGDIWGGTIHGGTIRGGEWHNAPLQIQGSKYYFNISDHRDGVYYIKIGCQNHSVDVWRERWEEIAEDRKAKDIVQEYARYFNLAAEMYGFEPVVIPEDAV